MEQNQRTEVVQSVVSRLAEAFYDCRLSKDQWTHHAHLQVGLWTIIHFPTDEALNRLRDGIKRFNEACGVVNSDHSGYHETITRFYVWIITRFLESAECQMQLDSSAIELIREHGDKNLPFQYWTKERLMSVEARHNWIEPDLRRLK